MQKTIHYEKIHTLKLLGKITQSNMVDVNKYYYCQISIYKNRTQIRKAYACILTIVNKCVSPRNNIL